MGRFLEENVGDRVTGMESEIATLRYVAESTSVPVPTVFGNNLGINEVGGPYIPMEMIQGEMVAQRIKRQGGISGSEVQGILTQMARYLCQISSLRFHNLGRLMFSQDPKFSCRLESFQSGTGPIIPVFAGMDRE